MSQVSLCSVVKALIVSLVRGREGRTMSPIELFWTAKNHDVNLTLFQKSQFFYLAGPNQNMTFQDLFPRHICLINPVCSWASYTISKCRGGARTAHSWDTVITNICQREIREIHFYKMQKYIFLDTRNTIIKCRGLKTTFIKSHSHCIYYL